MIDIHSHILPGIDDGSKDIEMTIEMLKIAEKSGTKEIIATPHYLLEYGEAKINEVKEYVENLNLLLSEKGIDIKVYSGQEVYFTENIVNDYENRNIGTLNDSRYMLIEFDMRNYETSIFDYLYELQIKGIVPIIAHPERYRWFIKKPEIINRFISEGYLFQLNAGSIEGKFGNEVKKTAQIFLKNDIYDFVGSDAHNTNSTRSTNISEAIKLMGKENMNKFNVNSKKLINNAEIEFTGKIIEKKSISWNIFNFRKSRR
ncbi:MAG TPA: capsular biosynthesis protein [Clostridium sp.]|nr:capsular biosynthesis protein [Clostridium sp.]